MYNPDKDCNLCSRLVGYRENNIREYPNWFNAPVPSFGENSAKLLIVGLAPGLRGANCTGRPFTGDYAGDLLYSTLLKFKFARGEYKADPNDGLELIDCLISNAVRCVPPENKPISEEITNCSRFLKSQIEVMPNLKVILVLGLIAHKSVISQFGLKQKDYKFSHGIRHNIGELILFNSYHCSRYNTNTNRLTENMFHNVFEDIRLAIR